MLSLKQLLSSTARLRSKQNPTSMAEVNTLAAIPVGNSFVAEARFRPMTEPGVSFHQATIVFHNMTFNEAQSAEFPIIANVTPNKPPVYMQKPSLSTSKVRIRCSCRDFFFTWWYYDKQRDSFAGTNMRPYIRKTNTYPERNPLHVPGLCKHLIELVSYLSQKGIIKP